MKTPKITIRLILCLLVFTNLLSAQNFSGLQGKNLNKIDNVESAISSILTKIDGKINSVNVTYDSEHALKFSIDYTGFETAYMNIRVVDAQKKSNNEISKVNFSLEGKTSPLSIELLLKDDVAEGTDIESVYLELKIGKTKNSFGKKIFLFALNKQWKKEINAENLIIPVKLEPIGTAANLKENVELIILPVKKQVIKSTIDRSKYYSISKNSSVRALPTKLMLNKPVLYNIKNNDKIKETSTTKKISISDGNWLNDNKGHKIITKLSISDNGKKIELFKTVNKKYVSLGKKTLVKKSINYYIATFGSRGYYTKYELRFDTNLKLVASNSFNIMGRSNKSTSFFNKQILFMATNIYTYNGSTNKPNNEDKEEEEEVSLEAEGPDNKPISLWDDLVADVDFEFPYEIANIRMDIYPDKNLASGVFYYLPSAYHLRWNSDDGYNFRMIYGEDDGSENPKNISMSSTITPNISSKEVALIKSLLQSYVQDNSVYTYTELKIMPCSDPKLTLSSDLSGQYNLTESDINISVTSTINNPIEASWKTNNTTKDEMQLSLSEGVGIKGVMKLKPNGEAIPEQSIPVRITISDTRTIGKLILQPNNWRTKNWINETPFPIKIKYVHALIIEKKNSKTTPLIYSWDLNNVEVPSKAQVQFDASKMPTWLETKNKTEQIWIEYSIVECTSCVNKIMGKLTNGLVRSSLKEIAFESIGVIEKTDAAFLRVKVRSIQADPKGNSVIELDSFRITEDMTSMKVGPFYLPEGENIQYEYFYTLVLKDATKYESDNWQSSTDDDMLIGMKSLKEAISNLPSFE
jgi:hypothetical protein